jgi:hypothetical protein
MRGAAEEDETPISEAPKLKAHFPREEFHHHLPTQWIPW